VGAAEKKTTGTRGFNSSFSDGSFRNATLIRPQSLPALSFAIIVHTWAKERLNAKQWKIQIIVNFAVIKDARNRV
jgi:hypothetical protein